MYEAVFIQSPRLALGAFYLVGVLPFIHKVSCSGPLFIASLYLGHLVAESYPFVGVPSAKVHSLEFAASTLKGCCICASNVRFFFVAKSV